MRPRFAGGGFAASVNSFVRVRHITVTRGAGGGGIRVCGSLAHARHQLFLPRDATSRRCTPNLSLSGGRLRRLGKRACARLFSLPRGAHGKDVRIETILKLFAMLEHGVETKLKLFAMLEVVWDAVRPASLGASAPPR